MNGTYIMELTFPGFGDIVPTEQVYMFFTMAYIIFGLALYVTWFHLNRRFSFIPMINQNANSGLLDELY